LVERITGPTTALAHVKASKSPKAGARLHLAGDAFTVEVTGRREELFELEFPARVLDTLEPHGATPLPPSITHEAQAQDEERYQTVSTQAPGAVAAPTPALHFDRPMLDTLAAQGVQHAFVTLHVGAGTFQPVRVEDLSQHQMHAERYVVPRSVVQQIEEARRQGGRVIAVGTTSVRALESAAAQAGCADDPLEGDTRLFITPGYRFSYVDAL